ncbi:bifunctional diaminohydroxyphosphoribosylaminopyrimidine deaminase/5-amino-6-(5-phosphoribosylamino)uracil reductase [Anaerosporomusa subterranea]|uniref:Riboflavin biosynthesis protein RibD n=1 Tax=Anaerosporomusa subterranea TaxID=1794912 RepID=A0A154BUK9_ANASB|nr:bifunctional diaminohydroxyphosphoribosylaminopyrimidine deaminase/5-amino-6-(5-phosphoribosylamino)uracil reductase RibD [Anaerosporomusa subterranea]KYZ77612.1 bifunctional diaminohydroxyphosphoribosylaminopyrimidine deaminase/5-amino-6-(5-phosphoribosylamino)uracil reductase [Anaerosporomusa subterranea]
MTGLDILAQDEYYMDLALKLARNGYGRTSPNPMVGALVVRDGNIVGQGWHQKAGTAHAEIHAMRDAGALTAGATLYVTLEPCCHHGRTGPCTDAIIHSRIRRVVFAMTDPNPCVAGCGAGMLRQAGIEVTEGVLACEAAKLNEAFIKYIATGLPFTAIKMAMTLDGKTVTASGHSQWITGEASRHRVHKLRDQFDAVLVGVGTVLADNPQLTVRHIQGRNPVRVVVDSHARTPLDSLLITDKAAHTIIAVSQNAPSDRLKAYADADIEVVQLPTGPSGIDLRALFRYLAQKGLASVLVEGGATINASIIQENLVDSVFWFIAPKLVGGVRAPGPIGGTGVARLEDAAELEDIELELVGNDLLITGYLTTREGRNVYRDCGRIRDSQECDDQSAIS